MAKMTKSQVLSKLAEKTGVSKKAAGQFMDEVVKLAYKEAKNSFTIPGLGKLVLQRLGFGVGGLGHFVGIGETRGQIGDVG